MNNCMYSAQGDIVCMPAQGNQTKPVLVNDIKEMYTEHHSGKATAGKATVGKGDSKSKAQPSSSNVKKP